MRIWWGPIKLLAAASALAAAFVLAGPASAATYHSGPVTYKSSAKTNVAANSPGFASVGCGSGRRVAASGVDSTTAEVSSEGFIDSDTDGVTDDGAQAFVQADSSSKLTGWAVCLGGTPASKLVYAHNDDLIGPGGFGVGINVSCSSGRVAGLGFRYFGATSDAQLNYLGLNFSSRDPDPLNAGGLFQKQGAAKGYTTQAACLGSSGGKIAYKVKTDVVFPNETRTIKAACPSDSRVIGGGWQGVATPLLASRPYDSSDKGKTPEDGWEIRVRSSFQGFAVQAFCLKK